MDPVRALTLQWLSSSRWGGGQSSGNRVGSGSEGVRRWEEAPEKHNGTPRVETKGVKSVHGHGRKRSRAEFSQQEVRQTSEGDVLRGAKMQRGGVRMGMGAEGCGGRGGWGVQSSLISS